MKSRILFPALLVATALRLAWVWTHEVSPSEAYYRMCSQRLAPAFFDGPSGTAFLVRAFGDSFLAARMFWPVLAFFCGWAAWIFVRRISDRATASWCALLLNALPVFNRAAVEVGPLMPALFFSLIGLVFARMAWEGRQWAWMAAGGFFAVGLWFRYEVVLIPFALVVGALSSRRRRAHFGGPLVMAALSALAAWPALAWNASLEWVPIAGGTWRSLAGFRPEHAVRSLGELVRALSLPVAVCVPVALAFLVRAAGRYARPGFLLASCAAVWVWCAYLVLHGDPAVVAACLGFVPLAGFAAMSGAKLRGAALAGWALPAIALATGALAFAPASGSWSDVAAEFRSAARDLPAAEKDGFFIAETPELAAVLGYHIPGTGPHPTVFVPESPDISNQFALWPSYADFDEKAPGTDEYFTEQKGANPYVGRNAVYIGAELPQTVQAAFTEVELLRTVTGPDGEPLGIYLCIGYETLPL
jgi:hypothetical protein